MCMYSFFLRNSCTLLFERRDMLVTQISINNEWKFQLPPALENRPTHLSENSETKLSIVDH